MSGGGTLSFRNKLKYAFLGVTMMAVLVTGGLSYSISASILEEKSLTLTQDSVDKSARIVDEKLSKLMLVMMTFMISEPFKDLLESVSSGDYGDYFRHLNNMDNVFSQARVAEPLIHSIYVSTPMGDFYPMSVNRNHAVTFRDTPMYERVSKEKRNVWVEGHEDQLFTGKQRVVTLILEPITDSSLFSVNDVYVVVNIRESGLSRLIEPESKNGAASFLVNGEGRLVGFESKPLIKQAVDGGMIGEAVGGTESGQTTRRIHDEDYLINFASLGLNDWKVVSIQSKNNVLKDMMYVKWMIAIIAAGCLAVAILASGVLIRFLLKPLKSLQSVMKRVESNDLTARFEVKNDDELAQIGIRFNRMLEQIVGLIEEVKEAETTKRATEIKALSAQMDPHFLYNALNTIYWKMKLKKIEESQHMVVSLSRLFQLGLNKGQEYTTLEKELLHVRQYLELQKYCYEDLFDYEIEVASPALEEVKVPRIMLQPLVENSIVHGFSSMERGGRIRVSVDADMEKRKAVIAVSDNGAGVDKAAGDLLRQTAEKGYALGNLLSRLRLYYGEDPGLLTADSEPGAGLTVKIAIPLGGGMQDGRTGTESS